MRRVVLIVGVLFILFLAAGVLFGRTLTAPTEEKREAQARDLLATYERHRAAMEADEARWVNDPLFLATDGGDAAELMAEHVGWDAPDAGLPAPRAPVPPEVVQRFRESNDGGWVDLRDDVILNTDVQWFSKLPALGFWDTDRGLEGVPFDAFAEPLPNFVALQAFAKVRLIQGLVHRDVVTAATEVRALVRLLVSTSSLVGAMVGCALLSIERHAYEAARAQGLEVSGWTPVSAADTDRLRAVLWAGPAMTSLLATGALAARRPVIGECLALREGVGGAHFLRGYLEAELPTRYAELDAALTRSPCRLSRLRDVWTSRSKVGQLPATGEAFCVSRMGAPGTCDVPALPLSLVPYSRAFIGNTLLSIAGPNWFKQYEKLEPAR
jgi:hypothetical protein